MASPLVCVVYVYEQFIQHHYIILSVLLTVAKWQLDGVLTDPVVCVYVCVYLPASGKKGEVYRAAFPSVPRKLLWFNKTVHCICTWTFYKNVIGEISPNIF